MTTLFDAKIYLNHADPEIGEPNKDDVGTYCNTVDHTTKLFEIIIQSQNYKSIINSDSEQLRIGYKIACKI